MKFGINPKFLYAGDRKYQLSINENLCRTDMSLAERAKMMVRRKELYEEKHPESRGGTVSARAANSAMGRNVTETDSVTFAASTAATIGKHERVVRLDVQRGAEIVPEALDLVTRTPLDKARYLNGLMRAPKEEQVERVRRDLAARQADPAPVEPAPSPTPPTDPDAGLLAWLPEVTPLENGRLYGDKPR